MFKRFLLYDSQDLCYSKFNKNSSDILVRLSEILVRLSDISETKFYTYMYKKIKFVYYLIVKG